MTRTNTVLWGAAFAGALVVHSAWSLAADAPMPKGFSSFGPDQTLADIGKLEWQPLNLEGLQPGAEVATLRGDLGKGGAEILVRVPANYISLPGNTPHALKCQGEPCIFYLRYGRPFDWHVHPMPK